MGTGARFGRVERTARSAAVIVIAFVLLSAGLHAAPEGLSKLDPLLRQRARVPARRSQVIVRAVDAASLEALPATAARLGGTLGRRLPGITSRVMVVPDAALRALAESPLVRRISLDREVTAAAERTGATIGATDVRRQYGYDGAGVSVAIVDSGVAPHPDLTDSAGAHRIARFVDFVGDAQAPYDDFGHGTHVAGIVAGNGVDSGGARAGVAPGAHVVVLKALDASGRGRISDVIAAVEYAVANRGALNIRVLNLSLAAGVYESFNSDPLALAAQRAVAAGILVVAAAGNNGISPEGHTGYGGITAPGNAPWVLTVGGSSHSGTTERADDTMAPFSSRGPAAIDHVAKPDIVAPGVGTESLAAPGSYLYSRWADYLLAGTRATAYLPYLSLSGTSMAAPVVSGTAALMLQANPGLSPNQIKAILQYTAEMSPYHDPLTQGAGFLNARGAVELAHHLAAPLARAYPDASAWSRRLIWGNRAVSGGRLTADANAWSSKLMWGAALTVAGKTVQWGVLCSTDACGTPAGDWTVQQTISRNVVWGTVCGGADCTDRWTLQAISGASEGETVVWGTTDGGDTVVWGTVEDAETVVWGTNESGDTVVWGTTEDGDTVVWGTSWSSASWTPTVWIP